MVLDKLNYKLRFEWTRPLYKSQTGSKPVWLVVLAGPTASLEPIVGRGWRPTLRRGIEVVAITSQN